MQELICPTLLSLSRLFSWCLFGVSALNLIIRRRPPPILSFFLSRCACELVLPHGACLVFPMAFGPSLRISESSVSRFKNHVPFLSSTICKRHPVDSSKQH